MRLSEQLQQDHESGDFGKALEGYAERAAALEEENERLRMLLNPRQWTKEMHDAWHSNLPDMLRAFEALRKLNN